MQGHKNRIGLVLAPIAWVCVGGLLEGCASRRGRPDAHSQQEASELGAQEQVARPGRDGTIRLRVPTRLADLQLKPGRYEFRQRVGREERFLHVMEVKRDAGYGRRGHDYRRFVAEVKCRVEASGERTSETAVYLRSEAGVARVEWITLAGEDGRYFPEAVQR